MSPPRPPWSTRRSRTSCTATSACARGFARERRRECRARRARAWRPCSCARPPAPLRRRRGSGPSQRGPLPDARERPAAGCERRCAGALPAALPAPANRSGDAGRGAPLCAARPRGHLHHAYTVVFQQNTIGGYYDVEGTDWLDPRSSSTPSETRYVGRRAYMVFADGEHIHMIAWRHTTPSTGSRTRCWRNSRTSRCSRSPTPRSCCAERR